LTVRDGVILALMGLTLTLLAGGAAAWSLWRLPGTNAGAAVSVSSGLLAVGGATLAVAGALVAYGLL